MTATASSCGATAIGCGSSDGTGESRQLDRAVAAGRHAVGVRCRVQNAEREPVAVPSAPRLLLLRLFPYENNCPLLTVLTPVPLRVMVDSLSRTVAPGPSARMPLCPLFTMDERSTRAKAGDSPGLVNA